MLSFLVLDNKRFDYKQLFLDIDTKVLQISKVSLYSAKYGIRSLVDYDGASKLLNYRSILAWKLSNPESLCNFELKDIVARIQALIYRGGFDNFKNSLVGCTNENCGK